MHGHHDKAVTTRRRRDKRSEKKGKKAEKNAPKQEDKEEQYDLLIPCLGDLEWLTLGPFDDYSAVGE